MSDPFTSLLDLDGNHRPGLRVRLDGEEYPLRAAEDLSLRDAFRLGSACSRLRQAADNLEEVDEVARRVAAIVAPELPAALGPTQRVILLASYLCHLADSFRRLTTPAGDPVPFSAPARASSRRRGSRRASASDCGSNSPCR